MLGKWNTDRGERGVMRTGRARGTALSGERGRTRNDERGVKRAERGELGERRKRGALNEEWGMRGTGIEERTENAGKAERGSGRTRSEEKAE